ncbi:MAG: PAS domain S-box protein [Planctomycetota bacterium]
MKTRWIRSIFGVTILLVMTASEARPQTVRVGVYENKPKVFTEPQGKASGIFIDIIRHIGAEEGWQLEFVPGTWSEGLKRLEGGEIDLMPDVAFSEKRAKIFDFNSVPVLSSWFHVYCHKEDIYESMLDLNGKRVVVLKGSIQEDVFRDLAHGFGLSCELVLVDDYKRSLELLDARKVDAVVLNRFYGKEHGADYEVKETSIMFYPSRLHYAAPKGRTEILQAVDRHMTALKADTRSEYYGILKRWFKDEPPVVLPRYLVTIGLALIAISVLAVGGTLLLKWQVNRRTEELRRSERNYREVFNGTNEAIVIHDSETGEIVDVNQTMLDMFGYGHREEVLRLSVADISANRDQYTGEEAKRWMRKAVEEGTQLVPWCCRRADGSEFYTEVGLTSTQIGGQGRLLAAIRDITPRREAEQARRESEERYRALVDGSPIPIFVHAEGRVVFANQATARVMGGTSSDDLLGKTVSDIVHPDYLEVAKGRIRDLYEKRGDVPLMEEKFLKLDGTAIDVEVMASVVNYDGRPASQVVFLDVTERKAAEKAASSAAKDWAETFHSVKEAIFIIDDDFQVLAANPAAKELFGREEIHGKRCYEIFHGTSEPPADCPSCRTFRSGQIELHELQEKHLGNRYFDVSSYPVTGEDGKIEKLVHTVRDVTERREAEKAVRESERKFRTLTETLAAFVVLVQGDEIVYVNPSAQTILGFPPIHFIGMKFYEPFHPDDRDAILERRKNREAGYKGLSRYDARLMHADGTYRWIDFSTFVTEFDGKPSILVTGFDVTERKQAEEALAKSEQRWREMYTQTPVMVMGVDEMGRISEVSDYWCRTLGYEREDFIGKNGIAMTPPGASEMLGETWERLIAGAETKGGIPPEFKKVLTGLATVFGDAGSDDSDAPPVIFTEDSGPFMAKEVENFFHRGLTGGDLSEYFKNAPVRMRKKDGTAIDVFMTTIFELDADHNINGMLSVAVDVTEEKKAVDALRVSEERFRKLYTQTPVMMCAIEDDGRIKDISNHWCRTLGYKREEVLGMPGTDFFTQDTVRCLDDFHTCAPGFLKSAKVVKNLPGQLVKKDGGTVDVLMTFVAEPGADPGSKRSLCVALDVTDQKRAEAALKESEARYRTLVENAPEAILVFDADSGRIVDGNAQAERLFGLTQEMLLEKTITDIVGSAVKPGQPSACTPEGKCMQDAKNVMDGAAPFFEWVITRENGEEIACEVRMTTLPASDRNWVRASVTDVTEQKQLRAQLQHQDKIAAVGMLAAGVAHEIGNPLLAISMAAQSLHRKTEDAYVTKKLDLISGHIDRISKIVQQMSDLARPPSEEKRRCDINEVIQRALEIVRYDKRAKQAEVGLELAPDLPTLTVVEDHLVQVFINLALNAADALENNPEDRPKRLQVASERVEADGGSHIRITFDDSGPGIPEGDLPKIFQPFFTTKEVGKGTGLGLAVSYRIIHDHGGEIQVESRVGEGTRFTIVLPVGAES